jgi:hypothetical protein
MPKTKADLENEVRNLKYDLMISESELKHQNDLKKYNTEKTRNAYAWGVYIIFALLVIFNVNEDYILWPIMAAAAIGGILHESVLKPPKHPHEK